MKHELNPPKHVVILLCIALHTISLRTETKKEETHFIWSFNDIINLKYGGEFAQEFYSANNINNLNSGVGEDIVHYCQTTFDSSLSVEYAPKKQPRLICYNAFRIRFICGYSADTKLADNICRCARSELDVVGMTLNKHLLWMREGWLQFMLGNNLEEHKHFMQIGLIPFELGRGISLGSAYVTNGFLGFSPGFSIDQYAPAVLFHIDPVLNKASFDCYFALLEHRHSSLMDNIQKVRTLELHASPERGIGHESYIVALRNNTLLTGSLESGLTIEPYVVYFKAPDQKIEFKHDVNVDLTTFGMALEFKQERVDWGVEVACNIGEMYIKPWDRNHITLTTNDSGLLVEQYTKIYNQNPKNKSAMLVDVTEDVETFVQGSSVGVAWNGKQIGTGLFNAYDRFRPAVHTNMMGYFLVADCSYDIRPKELQCSVGVGYASGYIDPQVNLNEVVEHDCWDTNFTGFVPIQSLYIGKRLRHYVVFNQGIPRFSVLNPNEEQNYANIAPSLHEDTIQLMTNIAFFGMRAAWNPAFCKERDLLIAPCVVAYWIPETSLAKCEKYKNYASNFLGIECNLEFSMKIFKDCIFSGYAGFLLPGAYYQDMKGTILEVNKKPIGNSVAGIADLSISYKF